MAAWGWRVRSCNVELARLLISRFWHVLRFFQCLSKVAKEKYESGTACFPSLYLSLRAQMSVNWNDDASRYFSLAEL